MLKAGPDSPPRRQSRARRRRARARCGLAWLGSLALLGSLGSGAAVAGPGVNSKITRSTTPQGTTQGTTPTDVTPVVPSQPVPTPATDGPLVVTMTATPDVVTVGQTVTYTANVSGAPPGKHVLYHWAFEGGTSVGEQITRAYPEPGEYPVAVTVTVASVAGLSGVADLLTVVIAHHTRARVPGSGSSTNGAGGTGNGRGAGGTGRGPSAKPAVVPATRARPRKTITTGVPNPLARQAPSTPTGVQVEGFLLTDAGVRFAPPVPTTPPSTSSGSGGSDAGLTGAGSAAGVGGAIALTIAIVTLGALDERRRISLRNA